MKLRLGQAVDAEDGLFGEVGDIVIDPHAKTVSHLVVEPHNQHHQARLVPMSLVTVEGDDVHVSLTGERIRQLDRVAYSDFVRFGQEVSIDDEWDIGTEDVVAMPYVDSWDPEFGSTTANGDYIDVAYDRIPKDECEIRRQSAVLSSDEDVVGHVEGFIADDDHLTGVVVRTGLPGLRHNVVVPMSAVAKVKSDEIELQLDRSAFGKLPKATGIEGPLGDHSTLDELQEHASHLVKGVKNVLRHAKDRVT